MTPRLEDGWVNSGYVFSQPDGRAIDPDLMTKAFKKMVKDVGMPHLTPHGLRHQYHTPGAFSLGGSETRKAKRWPNYFFNEVPNHFCLLDL
jgi:integrase